MGFVKNTAFQTGDLLRVRRIAGYYHYGIASSSNTAIHFSGIEGDNVLNPNNIKIIETSIESFLRGDFLEVLTPFKGKFSREEIEKRARNCIGNSKFNGKFYNLSSNNCEHFAKYCYYGNATRADTDRRFGWKVYLFPRGNKAVFAISLILPYISYLNESVYADFVRSVEAHYSDTFLGFNTITENAWDPLPATEENIKARYAVNKGVAFYFAAPGMDQCEPEDE